MITQDAETANATADVAGSNVGTGAWQPIETAPKDGTRVLLCGDPERYGRPIWIDWWDPFMGRWAHCGRSNPPATLIGWMLLPPPPVGRPTSN